jgi:signal transduction histidine kinase
MIYIFKTVFASIKKRLLFSFFMIILPLLLTAFGLVYVHFFVVDRYTGIIDNLIFENDFTNILPDFTRKYYTFVVSQKSRARLEEYEQTKEKIHKAIERLDKTITYHHSKVYYRGVRNIVELIIDNSDKGVASTVVGNLVDAMDRHDRNLSLVNYIKPNMSNLIIAELAYAGQLKKYTVFLHVSLLIIAGFMIIFVSAAVIVISFVLAGKITDPLILLSATAKSVAHGDFKRKVDASLCARRDEIGSLAESFRIMMEHLLAKIQETQAANVELREAQSQLIQAEKMSAMGQLSAGVAHEINNPMSAILCNQQLFKVQIADVYEAIAHCEAILSSGRDFDSQMAHDIAKSLRALKDETSLNLRECLGLVDDTCECVRRIKHIVSKLRNFAHPNIEKREPTRIDEVVDIALGIVASELKFNCVVKKNFKEVPNILCNKDELVQVVVNLLINASQAIKGKDGNIQINTYAADKYVFVEIVDNGEGIPKENISKIFDPFFTTKEVGEGTGLGLSIVYTIIEKHRGRIWVESELGEMTKVSIKIPVFNG